MMAIFDRSAWREQAAKARIEARVATGGLAIVQASVDLPHREPWALLAVDPSLCQSMGWRAWHDARDGTTFVALGRAISVADDAAVATPSALSDARRRWAAAVEPLGDPAGFDHLPFVLGSLPFDARPVPDALRAHHAALLVPRILVALAGGRVTATLTAVARTAASGPGDAPPLRQTVHEALTAIESAADIVERVWAAVPDDWWPGMLDAPGSSAHAASRADKGSRPGGNRGEPAGCEAWEAGVAAATARIAADSDEAPLRKVVLARSVALPSPPGAAFDPIATLFALRADHPASTIVGIADRPDAAVAPDAPLPTFVCATPESLVRVGGRVVETMALAGTTRVDADEPTVEATAYGRPLPASHPAAKRLLASAKDREEHRLVVDAIADTLAARCDHVDADRTPAVVAFGPVAHLRTRVHAMLRPSEASAADTLAIAVDLHPTPALGGIPRTAALRWIHQHEPTARGLYGAPLGWARATGDGVFVVGIRSATILPDRAVAWVGAGIVAGSEPSAEWRETELKLTPILDALSIGNGSATLTPVASGSNQEGLPR